MNWRDDRKRHTQHRASKGRLPASHLQAIDAMERYAVRFSPSTGKTVMTMLEDLTRISEHRPKGGAWGREMVGADPVRSTEDFLGNHPANPWTHKEQQRLTRTIHRAVPAEAPTT